MLTVLRIFLTQSVQVSLLLNIHPWTPWAHQMPSEPSCSQWPSWEKWKHMSTHTLLHACSPHHCSFSQKQRKTQMSIHWWMDRQYHGIVLSYHSNTCNKTTSQMHFIRWTRPNSNGPWWNDLRESFGKGKTFRERKQMHGVRGWEVGEGAGCQRYKRNWESLSSRS